MVSSSSISALVAFVFAAAELSSAFPIAYPLADTVGTSKVKNSIFVQFQPRAESRLFARGTSCNKKADCNNVSRPRNSFSQCKSNVCTFRCSTGYFWNANTSLCQMKSGVIASSAAAAAATTTRGPIPNPKAWTATPTTTAPPAASTTPAGPDESYMVDAKISSTGITGFNAKSLGWNTNAIMSWFRTDSTQDSTNGHSWCYNVYDNSQPGFAPDVSVMLANFQWSNTLAGAACKQEPDLHCGLEAEFVLPNGKTTKLILMDGFDPKWVKTPSSIDVIYDTFMDLWGSTMNDKNSVFQGVKWRFTGRRDSRYLFNTLN
ncbi:BQ5605_C004g02771 [Microbotryum silenes-dioicae]|uniref:BQ5605_C004g02771 protein n=1 Tax=Microbotryum silenes-dioicae TaxID=796604 RepID=A0A2X0P4B1_9BASI|nr:BQ5605_C004g02771 [Microbotryum silenes-dioicae]